MSSPRLGFLGVGWIGRHRMQAIAASGLAEVAMVADVSAPAAWAAAEAVGAQVVAVEDLEHPAGLGLDGLVIATPSALHASQAEVALASGVAVFCQKPLATSASECERVVSAAQGSGALLGVDMSYRYTLAFAEVRARAQEGAIGDIYAVDLVFHNAYGPDKSWAQDPALAGGGCVMDLGVHLVDMALWALAPAKVTSVRSSLFSAGRPVPARAPGAKPTGLEDFALARLDLSTGAVARLACSWHCHLGQEAEIGATFFGTRGTLSATNIAGSFFDFEARQHQGTSSQLAVAPPDQWGGRAAVRWAKQLAAGEGFDPVEAEEMRELSRVLDMVYQAPC